MGGVLQVNQVISDMDRTAATNIFNQGYGRLLDLIEQRKAAAGIRVYENRREAELQYTSVYKDLVYLTREEKTL